MNKSKPMKLFVLKTQISTENMVVINGVYGFSRHPSIAHMGAHKTTVRDLLQLTKYISSK